MRKDVLALVSDEGPHAVLNPPESGGHLAWAAFVSSVPLLSSGIVALVVALPQVDLAANDAPWNCVLREGFRHELVRHPGDVEALWRVERLGGVDGKLPLVVVPLVVVEAVPPVVVELVGVAIVEPVLVAPDPGALLEASLGGAPVMPLALVPSVPDAVVVRPLLLGDLGAGLADFAAPLVVLDELGALALRGEDLSVLSGNLMVVLESGVGDVPVPTFLEGEQGVITEVHEVLALLIHFFCGGCAGHHL